MRTLTKLNNYRAYDILPEIGGILSPWLFFFIESLSSGSRQGLNILLIKRKTEDSYENDRDNGSAV